MYRRRLLVRLRWIRHRRSPARGFLPDLVFGTRPGTLPRPIKEKTGTFNHCKCTTIYRERLLVHHWRNPTRGKTNAARTRLVERVGVHSANVPC